MDDRALRERMRAALQRPVVQDALVAVVLAYLSLVSLWSPPPFETFDYHEADALGVVLSLVAAGAVALRSRYPEAALLASLAGSLPLALLGYNQTIGGMASLLALYSVSVSRPSRVSLAMLAVTVVGVGLVLAATPLDPSLGQVVSNLFVIGSAWTIGRSVRVRRAHLHDIAARNRAQAAAYEAETRAMLVEERSLMAREMQDLVAHNLTEVGVQVAAARRLLKAGETAAAEQLLVEAEQVSRSAMDEMRRVVRMLGRSDGDEDLRPQPGVHDVEDLVRREADERGDVRFTTTGDPVGVPPGIALTAYRVVEEALQELRESDPGSVDVAVEWDVDGLCVRLRGEPSENRIHWDEPDPLTSHRIDRLRNRVQTYGGELRTSRTRDGDLTVSARFPFAASGRTS